MIKQFLMLSLEAALVVVLAISCGKNSSGSEVDSRDHYFSGEFTYMADAAVLRDCATGELVAVAMQDGFLELERAYLELGVESYQGVMCRVRGYIRDKEAGTEGHDKVLVVTSLIGFDRDAVCDSSAIICGDWELTKGAVATNELSLNPDYTYSLGNQVQGRWFLTAADSIAILDKSDKLGHGVLDYGDMSIKFKEVTYSKVAQ